jgi:hypothetical protein
MSALRIWLPDAGADGERLHVDPQMDEIVTLGPITLRIVSDVENFPALSYFSSSAVRGAGPAHPADFELYCLKADASRAARALVAMPDQTARSRNFASGYYVTDHFGPPACVVTRENRSYLIGDRLENLVWPYFVKYFLLRHAVAADSLFLKAAGLAVGGVGTLVLGRGGAGKTTFVSELCRRGAGFVTNSHAIIRESEIHGVASSMRIRPSRWLDRLGVASARALNPNEVMVDPFDVFQSCPAGPVAVRNICLVDFRGPNRHIVTPLSAAETYDFLEQFGLGMNVYRLEEDLLDIFDGDYQLFAVAYRRMKEQLSELAGTCRAYYISTDLMQATHHDEILALLGSAGGATGDEL